jgi:hypothetical protein
VERSKLGVYVRPNSSEDLFKLLIDGKDFTVSCRDLNIVVVNQYFDKKKLVAAFFEEVKSI